jgi:predicted XRE-type DNA-binding protein
MTTNHDPVEWVLPYRAEDLENTVTSSSGNVYADLGYENPEEMLLKAHLTMLLSKVIKAKDLIWVLTTVELDDCRLSDIHLY